MDGVALLTIFVLAVFVGFEVVSKVSSTLLTPLMSGANAIHGIILLGAVLVAGHADDPLTLVVALLAVVLARPRRARMKQTAATRYSSEVQVGVSRFTPHRPCVRILLCP